VVVVVVWGGGVEYVGGLLTALLLAQISIICSKVHVSGGKNIHKNQILTVRMDFF
jgi:hypothetical protein